MKKHAVSFYLSILISALLVSGCSISDMGKNELETHSSPDAVETVGSLIEESVEIPPVEVTAPPNADLTESSLRFLEREDSTSGEYTDALGNRYLYTYSLPVVSGSAEDSAAVNAALDEVFETYIAPDLQHMNAGHSLVTTYAAWRTAEYNGITSLIVCLKNTWDNCMYYVYSFTAEGKQATNTDLFAALGISGEEFTASASKKMSDYLGVEGAEDRSEEIRASLEENRQKTLSPENCNTELPIYITSYGTVCFVGRVYIPAGAGYCDHLFILAPQTGFSAEELAALARDFYGIQYGQQPESAAFETNEDGTVLIKLYQHANDPDSICECFSISPESGVGVDSRNKIIDLTVQ